MNNQLIFSVIVPVYNAELYVKKCIKSILNQTFSGFELILVDDGSQDRSLEICNQFSENDSRIIVLNQTNQGVSSARNTGIKLAKGRYITFIDSDDFIDDDYLENFNKIICEDKYDLIVSGIRIVHEGKKPSKEYKSKVFCAKSVEEIASFVLEEEGNDFLFEGSTCKCFLREKICDFQLLFDSNFHYGEDLIFILNFLKIVGSIYVSDYVGYNYLRRKSMSLVKTKYPFETTKTFVCTFTTLRYEIFHRYKLSEVYLNFIEKEKTLHTISAISSMYHHKFRKDKQARKVLLENDISNLDLSFLPSGKYYRLLKFIFQIKNVYIMDFLLNILFKAIGIVSIA